MNNDNICSVSTHKRTLGVSGRILEFEVLVLESNYK